MADTTTSNDASTNTNKAIMEIKRNLHREMIKQNPVVQSKIGSIFQSFGIGAAASAIGATAVYPIDLVKTRLQNQRNTPGVKKMGGMACFTNVLRHEGPLGLYKGLIPQLVGQVPEKAMRLFVVDYVRSFSPSNDMSLAFELLAGLCAGTTQVMITNPAEIIKVRLQVQGEELVKLRIADPAAAALVKPKGPLQMIKELGLKGLYKGSSACFLRDIPFSGIYFSSYAWLKELVRKGEEPLHSGELLICASLAGVAAASVTTPADVVKTRMQVEAKKGEGYSSMRDCFKKVVQNEGFGALLKGLVPRVLRSSPQYGVMLLSYELLQRLFSEDISSTLTLDSLENKKWAKMLLLEDKMGFLLENRVEVPSAFTKFEGGFKHISMGSSKSIWALSFGGEPFYWTGSQWIKPNENDNTDLRLRQISAGYDGTVWGVLPEGGAVRWDEKASAWVSAPSSDALPPFQHVTVGGQNDVWAIVLEKGSPDGGPVMNWDGKEWKMIGGEGMKHISCGSDGTLWGVNAQGFTYLMRRDKNQWQQMPGSFKQVSVGSARHVWGVDSNDAIYKWKGGEKYGRWERVSDMAPGGSQHFTAGGDGAIVGLKENESSSV